MVPAGSDPAIAGRTYYTVMGDMVNFYAWAQNDVSSGTARGGWRYAPNMEDPNPWGATSDNSVSQWPALGLITAEAWGISAPAWVKSELLNYWLAYSQNTNGGFGYADSGSPYVPMTAAGLIELTYCGVPTTDPRWDAARSFIGNNWASDNIGNMYAMYAVMKAAMTATPAVIWNFTVHTWQKEYDDYLVNASQVKPDGYWPATGRESAPTQILATEWALLILEKIAPPPPHVTLAVNKFFTDSSLCPLPLDCKGNPKVDVVLAGGVVRSTNPGQVLAWVNVTNTAGVPLQSLKLNETLEVDWVVDPPWMPAKGAIHVYFANTTSLSTNPEITQPSTITVSRGNPQVVRLAIPSFNATLIGRPLMPGQSILLSVKLTYGLKGTSQSATSYPRNYTDTASAAAWPKPNYVGPPATGSATAFFIAYAKPVDPARRALRGGGSKACPC